MNCFTAPTLGSHGRLFYRQQSPQWCRLQQSQCPVL